MKLCGICVTNKESVSYTHMFVCIESCAVCTGFASTRTWQRECSRLKLTAASAHLSGGGGEGDEKVASILWRVDWEFTGLTDLRVILPSASLGAETWWPWALAGTHSSA